MTDLPATASHERVLQQIGRQITGGQLAPGTVVTLASLMSDFNASRTVIREAVRVLEDHGLLRSRRRVGITVCEPSEWDSLNSSVIRWRLDGPRRADQLRELMELRTAVEPVAASLAAVRATDEQRDELGRLAAVMQRLGEKGEGDGDAYLAADIRFHALLLTASGNPLLARLADAVREILVARTVLGLTPAVPHPAALRAHVDVAAAVAAGDAAAAGTGAETFVTIVSHEVLGQSVPE